jgi:hypothetical protein
MFDEGLTSDFVQAAKKITPQKIADNSVFIQ